MSIKVNYLHNHLDCSLENLGDLSEELGARFHQDKKLWKRDPHDGGLLLESSTRLSWKISLKELA